MMPNISLLFSKMHMDTHASLRPLTMKVIIVCVLMVVQLIQVMTQISPVQASAPCRIQDTFHEWVPSHAMGILLQLPDCAERSCILLSPSFCYLQNVSGHHILPHPQLCHASPLLHSIDLSNDHTVFGFCAVPCAISLFEFAFHHWLTHCKGHGYLD